MRKNETKYFMFLKSNSLLSVKVEYLQMSSTDSEYVAKTEKLWTNFGIQNILSSECFGDATHDNA